MSIKTKTYVEPEVGHNTYYWLGAALVIVGLALSGVDKLTPFAVTSIGFGALLVILGAHWHKYVTLRSVVLHQQRRIEALELDTEQRIRTLELAKIRIDARLFPEVPVKVFDEGKLVPQHESLDR